MQPTVSPKSRLSPDLRQRIIDLRRTHSLREVAAATGLPLGTVKTIASRSGRFRDNEVHRQLFSLPPIQPSTETLPVVPELPQQQVVTGDNEVDAALWLRQVIGTGQAALIDKAMEAAKRLTTPLPELEKRYTNHLMRETGSPFAALSAFGFADLEGHATKSIERHLLQIEALARFGDALMDDTPAEAFCIETLVGLEPTGPVGFLDEAEVAERFKARPELLPHTLADCLHELAYWDALYRLRHAARTSIYDDDEGPNEAYARRTFTFGLLAEIRPRSRDEAKAALRYLIDNERKDDTAADAILDNLIG